jgi:hypothetical protein
LEARSRGEKEGRRRTVDLGRGVSVDAECAGVFADAEVRLGHLFHD